MHYSFFAYLGQVADRHHASDHSSHRSSSSSTHASVGQPPQTAAFRVDHEYSNHRDDDDNNDPPSDSDDILPICDENLLVRTVVHYAVSRVGGRVRRLFISDRRMKIFMHNHCIIGFAYTLGCDLIVTPYFVKMVSHSNMLAPVHGVLNKLPFAESLGVFLDAHPTLRFVATGLTYVGVSWSLDYLYKKLTSPSVSGNDTHTHTHTHTHTFYICLSKT